LNEKKRRGEGGSGGETTNNPSLLLLFSFKLSPMKRLLPLLAALAVASCTTDRTNPTAPTATTTGSPVATTTGTPSTTTTDTTPTSSATSQPTASTTASATASATPSASASAGGFTPPNDRTLPNDLVACSADADCVAVDRAGCCHNGWKEAVAAKKVSAYNDAYKCTVQHQMCPMYMVNDGRTPKCDATKKCVLVGGP
jgi:hypothetical protein